MVASSVASAGASTSHELQELLFLLPRRDVRQSPGRHATEPDEEVTHREVGRVFVQEEDVVPEGPALNREVAHGVPKPEEPGGLLVVQNDLLAASVVRRSLHDSALLVDLLDDVLDAVKDPLRMARPEQSHARPPRAVSCPDSGACPGAGRPLAPALRRRGSERRRRP